MSLSLFRLQKGMPYIIEDGGKTLLVLENEIEKKRN